MNISIRGTLFDTIVLRMLIVIKHITLESSASIQKLNTMNTISSLAEKCFLGLPDTRQKQTRLPSFGGVPFFFFHVVSERRAGTTKVESKQDGGGVSFLISRLLSAVVRTYFYLDRFATIYLLLVESFALAC